MRGIKAGRFGRSSNSRSAARASTEELAGTAVRSEGPWSPRCTRLEPFVRLFPIPLKSRCLSSPRQGAFSIGEREAVLQQLEEPGIVSSAQLPVRLDPSNPHFHWDFGNFLPDDVLALTALRGAFKTVPSPLGSKRQVV